MVETRQRLLSYIERLLKDARLAAKESTRVDALGRIVAHIYHIDIADAQCAADYLKRQGCVGEANRLTHDVIELRQKAGDAFNWQKLPNSTPGHESQQRRRLAALHSKADRLVDFLCELKALAEKGCAIKSSTRDEEEFPGSNDDEPRNQSSSMSEFDNDKPLSSTNVFKKVGDTWTIGFEGDPVVSGIKDCLAIRRIKHVLSNQKGIDICDLPGNSVGKPQTKSVAAASIEDGKTIKQQMLEAAKELEEEIDPTLRRKIQEKCDALATQYNQNFDKWGNPRKLPGDLERSVSAAQRDVNRWKRANRERFPNLVSHLDKFLTISAVCEYTAAKHTSWDL